MEELISLYKNSELHHAYAIEGDKKITLAELYNFFEKDLKIRTKANPDFYFNEFENFGIDNSRELQSQASRKSITGNTRVFIIAISSITIEAQNALLKLFEEPPKGVHFFIIVPTSYIFLPTLRSRVNIIKPKQKLSLRIDKTSVGMKFLKASKSERIKMINDIIEEKNKEKAIDFLNDLEVVLHNKDKLDESKNFKNNSEIFEMIQNSREYLRGRAPLVKMILENICISI